MSLFSFSYAAVPLQNPHNRLVLSPLCQSSMMASVQPETQSPGLMNASLEVALGQFSVSLEVSSPLPTPPDLRLERERRGRGLELPWLQAMRRRGIGDLLPAWEIPAVDVDGE